MSVDTNANAELAMRVKALESDVAWLRQRERLITDQLFELIKEVKAFRIGAGDK